MTDFIKKWCNSEYFDSRENPAEEMAKDLQAAIAKAVKEAIQECKEAVEGSVNPAVYERKHDDPELEAARLSCIGTIKGAVDALTAILEADNG